MVMEKIKIDEYARTTEGYIGKIYKIDIKNFEETGYFIDNKRLESEQQGFPIAECRIKRHSFDKMDLVEVGDYVDGLPVLQIIERNGLKLLDVFGVEKLVSNFESILTKEQFEREEYIVGD